MIFPQIRGTLGRAEAAWLLTMIADDAETREREENRLREEGFDSILDDPRTLNAVLAGPGLSTAPAALVFYLLVRHALLEDGINNPIIADYLATLLLEFSRGRRAFRIRADEEEEYDYLVDIVDSMTDAKGREAFILRAHLGNFSLWLSGLFPDRITARVHRRGAPGLRYYEELGATGFRLAADTRTAESYGLAHLYLTFAQNFPSLRIALNRIADRYLFPSAGDPTERLLRQVGDAFRGQAS